MIALVYRETPDVWGIETDGATEVERIDRVHMRDGKRAESLLRVRVSFRGELLPWTDPHPDSRQAWYHINTRVISDGIEGPEITEVGEAWFLPDGGCWFLPVGVTS